MKKDKNSSKFGIFNKIIIITAISLTLTLVISVILLLHSAIRDPVFEWLDISVGEDVPKPDGTVAVHFIDVGQGDGILIRTKDGDIVIDTGTNENENDFLMYLRTLGVESLEYLVITHPHSDHMGGADLVLESLRVKRVIMPDTPNSTSAYLRMKKLVIESGAELIYPKVGEKYSLGAFAFTVLAPISPRYDNYNDYSVVLRADYGESSFLFVGDAEELSEIEMLKTHTPDLLDVDVLKVGHHGSHTSSSPAFISRVTPEYAVISCGVNNDYGHPHDVTLVRFGYLEDLGKLYRTDLQGDIVFLTDGTNLIINTSK